MTASTTAAGPAEFLRAVARLDIAHVRTEVEIGPLPAPARLAPGQDEPWPFARSPTISGPTCSPRLTSCGPNASLPSAL